MPNMWICQETAWPHRLALQPILALQALQAPWFKRSICIWDFPTSSLTCRLSDPAQSFVCYASWFGVFVLWKEPEKLLADDSSDILDSQGCNERNGRNLGLILQSRLDVDIPICFADEYLTGTTRRRHSPAGKHHITAADDFDYGGPACDSQHRQAVL